MAKKIKEVLPVIDVNADIKNKKEDLSEAIEKVAKGVTRLLNETNLKAETIEILIQHKCGISRANIRKVLEVAGQLDKFYLKKK